MTLVDFAPFQTTLCTAVSEKKWGSAERLICKVFSRIVTPSAYPGSAHPGLLVGLIGNLLDILTKRLSIARRREISLNTVIHLLNQLPRLGLIYPISKTPSREEFLVIRDCVKTSLMYMLDTLDSVMTMSEIKLQSHQLTPIRFERGNETSISSSYYRQIEELLSSVSTSSETQESPGSVSTIDLSTSKTPKC